MDVNILDQKLELIQWLSTLEDSSVIEELLQLKNNVTTDWWADISDATKDSINIGIAQADDNELIDHSLVRKLYEKWL